MRGIALFPIDKSQPWSYYVFSNTKYLKNESGKWFPYKDGGGLKQKYEQQMKKGVLEMLVLKLLSEEEKYGYQLISELKEKSRGMFLLKEGTLYPILYRMEDDGLVVSRWSEPKGKEVSKKYYRLAQEGQDTLAELEGLWEAFSRTVDGILGHRVAEEQEDAPGEQEGRAWTQGK